MPDDTGISRNEEVADFRGATLVLFQIAERVDGERALNPRRRIMARVKRIHNSGDHQAISRARARVLTKPSI